MLSSPGSYLSSRPLLWKKTCYCPKSFGWKLGCAPQTVKTGDTQHPFFAAFRGGDSDF